MGIQAKPVEELDPRGLARAAEIAAAEGDWERYRVAMFRGASVGKHREQEDETNE